MRNTSSPIPFAIIDHIQFHLTLLEKVAEKSLRGIEELVDLNVRTSRQAGRHSTQAIRECIAARRPAEFGVLMAGRIERCNRKPFTTPHA